MLTLVLKLLQWNIHALVPESTQAREDRKKRVRAGVAVHLRPAQLIFLLLPFAERTQKAGKGPGISCPTFGRHPLALNTHCADADATTCAATTHEHPHASFPWRQTRIGG